MSDSLSLPSSLLLAEAAEAPEVVARALAANRQRLERLVAALDRKPPSFVATVARGSSDNAADFARYCLESSLGLVTASVAPSTVTRYGADLRLENGLLLAISNRTPAEAKAAVETGPERALALELAVEAAALREDLHGLRHGRGPRLVDNLERIFLQVANLPDGEYAEGMALVRSTLERQAILLEMSLERLRGELSRERPQA